MKKIFTNPYWKSLFVISLLIATIFLFSFITNKDIKTFIGLGGFLLVLFSLYQKKKAGN